MGVALDGDGRDQTRHSQRSVCLWKRSCQQMMNIAARGEEGRESDDKKDRDSDSEKSRYTPLARGNVRIASSGKKGSLIVGLRKTHLVLSV